MNARLLVGGSGLGRLMACMGLIAVFVFLGTNPESPGQQGETLHIFAASSLQEAFAEIEGRFEAQHQGAELQLSFGGSQLLRLQIEAGAPAQVFASANSQHLQDLADQGLMEPPRRFAANELVAIVPRSSDFESRELGIWTVDELVIGAATVPLGAYTRDLFRRWEQRFGSERVSKLRGRVVSEEMNARLVRAKVAIREAGAAIVYRTDALSSAQVLTVELPLSAEVRAEYGVGAATTAAPGSLARAFVAYLGQSEAQAILKKHGFLEPSLLPHAQVGSRPEAPASDSALSSGGAASNRSTAVSAGEGGHFSQIASPADRPPRS